MAAITTPCHPAASAVRQVPALRYFSADFWPDELPTTSTPKPTDGTPAASTNSDALWPDDLPLPTASATSGGGGDPLWPDNVPPPSSTPLSSDFADLLPTAEPEPLVAATLGPARPRIPVDIPLSPSRSYLSKAPKIPSNAFGLFLRSQGSTKAKDQTPGAWMTDVAARWRALSDADRAPFLERAKQLREEYKAQLLAFQAQDPVIVAEMAEPLLGATVKASRARKTNPYALYVAHMAKTAPKADGQPATEWMQQVARQWKALTDLEKAPFRAEAADLNSQFAEQKRLEAYTTPERHRVCAPPLSPTLIEKLPTLTADSAAPPPPKHPANPYVLFIAEHMKSKPEDMVSNHWLKEGGKRWKEMTDEEKAPFTAIFRERRAVFLKAKEEYHAKYSPDQIAQRKWMERAGRRHFTEVTQAGIEMAAIRHAVSTGKRHGSRREGVLKESVALTAAWKVMQGNKVKVAGYQSAFSFFMMEMHAGQKHSGKQPMHIIAREAAEAWKDMSIEEKQPYLLMAAEDRKRYDWEVAQLEVQTEVRLAGKTAVEEGVVEEKES
ncbi:hypothetical protein GGF32_006715 [Allomyces javanicus]|nr:hypothetical protein GGF32_006715 [Allomyces javanicus]